MISKIKLLSGVFLALVLTVALHANTEQIQIQVDSSGELAFYFEANFSQSGVFYDIEIIDSSGNAFSVIYSKANGDPAVSAGETPNNYEILSTGAEFFFNADPGTYTVKVSGDDIWDVEEW